MLLREEDTRSHIGTSLLAVMPLSSYSRAKGKPTPKYHGIGCKLDCAAIGLLWNNDSEGGGRAQLGHCYGDATV